MTQSAYETDLLAQPAALRAAVAGFDPSLVAPFVAGLQRGRFDRVVLTGMGASLFAAYPAWLLLMQAGIPAWLIEAGELLHTSTNLVTSRTLLWVVSQSGRSVEVPLLLEQTAPQAILATTNDPASPLGQRADAVLELHAGTEATVGCKTYVATLAVIQLAAAQLVSADVVAVRDELVAATAASADFLAQWQEQHAAVAAALGHPERLVIVGRGSSVGSAWAGGLICKEAAKFHAEGMSAGQFRHGPIEMVDKRLTVLVLEGGPATAHLNWQLATDVQSCGAKVCWIGPSADVSLPRLPLPTAHGAGLPLAEILPLQLVSVVLAEQTGWQPGAFRHISKVTSTQ